jgi:isopentenyl-diphosphate delta-isomerase
MSRESVEVVDELDKPLCILSLKEANKQFLYHRTIVLFIFDARGKVLLRKRDADAEFYPGRWDVSLTGHVRAGESRNEAASRRLRRKMGLRVNRLVRRHEIPASSTNQNHFTTVFSTVCSDRDAGLKDLLERDKAMFVDRDELESMAANHRETLTPYLVLYIQQGLVFSDRQD